MANLQSLINEWTEQLAAVGIAYPKKEVEHIAAVVMETEPEALFEILGQALDEEKSKQIQQAITARAQRVPIPRIFGTAPFCDLTLRVAEGVYRPYPESEYFVEHIIMMLQDSAEPMRILDLGTGTGCLLLALLKALPKATGLGIDNDEAAVSLARQNAEANDVSSRAEFRLGNWCDGITEQFDLIVCNPPRVATKDLPRLLPEMRNHDPLPSLDGGADGIECFRHIAPCFSRLAKPDALGAFQVGIRYHDAVVRLFRTQGFADITTKHNYLREPIGLIVKNIRRNQGFLQRVMTRFLH